MLEARKKRVIDLYNKEGRNTREIASIERISIRDISAILKEEETRNLNHEEYMKHQSENILAAKAYRLFDIGKTPMQVSIDLKQREPSVSKLYKEYLKLKGLVKVVLLYEKIGDDAWSYLELYELADRKGMNNEKVVRAVATALKELPDAEQRFHQLKQEADTLQEKKRYLLRDIDFLEDKKSRLTKDITDINERISYAAEYRNMKKDEIGQLRKEEQMIRKVLTNHQKMILTLIIMAVQIYMRTLTNAPMLGSRLYHGRVPMQQRKIEDVDFEGKQVHEMDRSDIAE